MRGIVLICSIEALYLIISIMILLEGSPYKLYLQRAGNYALTPKEAFL